MTDAEFWAVMAITCEKAGVLPDIYPYGIDCGGLCVMLDCAFRHGLISWNQHERLEAQLTRVRPTNTPTNFVGYWWPKGKLAPRVRAMKKLAKLAMEEQ